MHCLFILPFICSYMWDLTSKTHIWCVSDFVLKIGYYTSSFNFVHCLYEVEEFMTHLFLVSNFGRNCLNCLDL